AGGCSQFFTQLAQLQGVFSATVPRGGWSPRVGGVRTEWAARACSRLGFAAWDLVSNRLPDTAFVLGARSEMPARLHFGPARVPARESPKTAVEALLERGYSACEIDFEGRFWMDYDFAAEFGRLAREHGIVLSVHAPIAGFMGHAERG